MKGIENTPAPKRYKVFQMIIKLKIYKNKKKILVFLEFKNKIKNIKYIKTNFIFNVIAKFKNS